MSKDPVLKKIFNRFYPKSQTANAGKKLYVLAWIIEIIVVIAGLVTAFIFLPTEETSEARMQYALALPFVVAAIAELTKIPLATAFYYATRVNWRLTFLVALLLINFLTFETISNGLLRNFNLSTAPIKSLSMELAYVTNERINGDLIANNKKNEIREEKVKINEERDNILKQKTKLQISQQEEIQTLNMNASGKLKNDIETRKSKLDKIDKLEDKKISLVAEACDDGGLISFGDDQCSNQKEVSDDLQRQIDRLNQEVNDLDRAIEKTTSDVSINNEARINSINERYRLQITSIDERLEELDEQDKTANEKISAYEAGSVDRIQRGKELEDREKELIKEINQLAVQNMFYTIAHSIKNFFEDKDEDDASVEDKSAPLIQVTGVEVDNKEVTIEKKDDETTKEVGPMVDAGTQALMSHREDQYHLLTGYDLNFAFWLFFGSMALVISLAGSLVALASLYLQDQRVHEERINQGKFGPIAKFFRSIQYSFIALRKRLTNPKIVEKEKEVVVEKEVIKEVPVDKIVFRDVPKEIIRRELVHVPMYTNDKDLLGTTTFKDIDVTTEELDEALREIRKKNKKVKKTSSDEPPKE